MCSFGIGKISWTCMHFHQSILLYFLSNRFLIHMMFIHENILFD